jgi:hypothetical protein
MKRAVLLVVVVFAMAALACGSDNTGEKVDEAPPAATEAPPKVETYNAGDVIQVKDHTIVLNSTEFAGNLLKANFTVENKGSEDLNLSSMLHFTAKDDEGSKLEQEIFECDPLLDGSTLPGDKTKGYVCWKTTGNAPYKVYYEASLFGSGAVVWQAQP